MLSPDRDRKDSLGLSDDIVHRLGMLFASFEQVYLSSRPTMGGVWQHTATTITAFATCATDPLEQPFRGLPL